MQWIEISPGISWIPISILNLWICFTLISKATKPDNSTPPTFHIAGTCFSAYSNITHNESWIIDLGASSHICHQRSLFMDLQPVSNISVVWIPVEFIRNILLLDIIFSLWVPHFNMVVFQLNFLVSLYYSRQVTIEDNWQGWLNMSFIDFHYLCILILVIRRCSRPYLSNYSWYMEQTTWTSLSCSSCLIKTSTASFSYM